MGAELIALWRFYPATPFNFPPTRGYYAFPTHKKGRNTAALRMRVTKCDSSSGSLYASIPEP